MKKGPPEIKDYDETDTTHFIQPKERLNLEDLGFNQGIRIGLIQMSCSSSTEENLKKATSRIEEAAKKGAQIVCLPELFRTRYFCQEENPALKGLAEPIPGPTTELLSPLARKFGAAVITSIYERDGDRRYNTAVAIDTQGKLLGKYRKIHIPDDLKNYYGETFYFQKGDLGTPVFETSHGRIGLQVCYDQWFPEGARALTKGGAQILLYPTAIGWSIPPSPLGLPRPTLVEAGGRGVGEEGDEYDAWLTIQRGHAISNGVFVACCNRVGREDHIDFWGTSFVCDPMGKVLAQASEKKEELLLVDCDLSRIEEVRQDWPFLKES